MNDKRRCDMCGQVIDERQGRIRESENIVNCGLCSEPIYVRGMGWL